MQAKAPFMHGISTNGWTGGLASEDNSPLRCNGASKSFPTEVLLLFIQFLSRLFILSATLLV